MLSLKSIVFLLLSFLYLFLINSIFLSDSTFAQCTDSDSDGYYYEEDCGTPRDCNDANIAINPGATEICNGYDDDCDSSLDEVCDTSCDDPDKWGSDIQVTEDPSFSGDSSLIWNGSRYGISWVDSRNLTGEIYFAQLDSSGNKIGSDVRVTYDPSNSYEPSLIWTGIEYGVSWTDARDTVREIYFARLDSSGIKIGSDVRVTADDSSPSYRSSLVWTGIEYGVSWQDDRGGSPEIYFSRLDSSGNKIGSDVGVTTDDSIYSSNPSLVWNGSDYGVSWYDGRDGNAEIYFARLDSSGNKLDLDLDGTADDVRVTNDSSNSAYPCLVWNGSEYGISWQDYRDGNDEIYFARIDSSGSKIGTDVRVTYYSSDSIDSYLVWSGSEYGVSWLDFRDGNEEIYFARIDSSGSKIGTDVRVTYDSTSSGYTSLAWTGSEYGISWDDDFMGPYPELYFALIKCCGNALDALITGLFFEEDKETMNWGAHVNAELYDVMRGDLVILQSTGGDFTDSLTSCHDNDSMDPQSFDDEEPVFPGDGYYYIVRAQADCRDGTCNCGYASQIGDRDLEIEASAYKCP